MCQKNLKRKYFNFFLQNIKNTLYPNASLKWVILATINSKGKGFSK